jgi:hypothetical protein
MPSAEETQQYLTGAWRMMMGRTDGLKLLDLSLDGFWNSFFAIAVALPPLIVSWVGAANGLGEMSAELGSRLSVVARLAIIDISTWLVPLALLAAIASRVGIADRFVHIVVAGNWGTAVIAWLMLPGALFTLFWPAASDVDAVISLVLFILAMVLSWRLTNIAVGKGPAVATAVYVGMFIASLAVLFILQQVLGLVVPAQTPAG